MSEHLVSYSSAVTLLRQDIRQQSLVKDAYLDEDVTVAWSRFYESEEWSAVREKLVLQQSNLPCSVLDIGCGNGIASMAFARAGAIVTAMDPDGDPSVGCAALRTSPPLSSAHGKVTVARGCAEALPFKDSSFDIVYGRQVLHHFSDLESGVRECARTLRPGGSILFCREHVVDSADDLEEFLSNHPLHRLHGGENAYPLTRYLSAFRSSDLVVREVIAPFDSVINHFPTSNATVESWLRQGLQKRLGRALGAKVAANKMVQRLYRRRLSRKCTYPGRLFSFLLERRRGL